MSNFPALEVVIGLCFVYFVLSLICSAVTESIASLRGWRAAKLELGIKNLLSGSDTVTKEGEALAKQVYDHPLVQALVRPKTGTKRRQEAALAVVHPVAHLHLRAPRHRRRGVARRERRRERRAVVDVDVQKAIAAIPSPKVQQALLALYHDAKGDLESFRRNAEQWFDDSMQRVSGWYKPTRLDRPLDRRRARRRVPERRHAARRQHALDRSGDAGRGRRPRRQGRAAGLGIAERVAGREQPRASARLEAVQARRAARRRSRTPRPGSSPRSSGSS